ncbi:tensin-4 [Bifidobacterium longum]|uniref:tensin-4 n=1 Tax=Bifidobacterium longum TaxID=216816 RepID=UPI001F61EE9F|nr:tensin-4 [Bifidobacterium longum]
MPTISLRITCKGNTLGDIDALPVPVSVTPSGHLVVDPLEPVMRRAMQAFADAWQRSCDKAGL